MSPRKKASRLTEAQLLAYAGEIGFARGEEYVRYVHGLRVQGSKATASIQAKRVYTVQLEWSGPDLSGDCTCPHFDKGYFCKHLVALGLAVLDERGTPRTPNQPEADLVAAWLERQDAEALRLLVHELCDRDEAAYRLLQVRAAVAGGDSTTVASALAQSVTDALRHRGFIDYRRSFDVARSADEMLDGMERHLNGGAAELVQPALLRAVTRLRKITEQADDSSGLLGAACQRAAELYAAACRGGNPDPAKLGRWMAKFRDESPGWPYTPLADFAPALGEKGVEVYRKAVSVLDHKYAEGTGFDRFEIDRMLLELADHDGDVDRAIELLTSGEHPSYGAVISRLRNAGRHDEILAWIDTGVAAGRVGTQRALIGDYWLDPEEVADTYIEADRPADALEVLQGHFARRPEHATLRLLLSYAERCGRADEERARALATAREQASAPFGSGAALVEIALAEGHLDAAWSAATEFGAGHMWRQLATASADERPKEAAELFRPYIEEALVHADTKKYATIAEQLAAMGELYDRADAFDVFALYVTDIRARYGRRPSLMAALDRQGL